MLRSLSPAVTLDIWERGSALHPLDRALLVLDCCFPEYNRETILDLSIGRRDELLFEVYRQTFGDLLEAYTECPVCHERLEFSISSSTVLNDVIARELPSACVNIDGIEFSIRPINSRDAAVAAAGESIAAAKKTLLARCATPVAGFEGTIDLPEPTQTAIAAQIAALDPHAELLMDLVCPACSNAWEGVFEIIHFLWAQIRSRARRLLQEIDALARVYGWCEADILNMTEARRSLYVQMALA